MRLRHLVRAATFCAIVCNPPDCKNKHVASPRCITPRCKHLFIEKDRGPNPVHIQREAGSRSIDRSPPHAPTSPARWRLRMAAGCGGEARAVRACARAWGGERAARARGGEHAARRPRAQPSPHPRPLFPSSLLTTCPRPSSFPPHLSPPLLLTPTLSPPLPCPLLPFSLPLALCPLLSPPLPSSV